MESAFLDKDEEESIVSVFIQIAGKTRPATATARKNTENAHFRTKRRRAAEPRCFLGMNLTPAS